MPRRLCWHFSLKDTQPADGVYIGVGNQVLSKYGLIKDVALSPQDGDEWIKVSVDVTLDNHYV